MPFNEIITRAGFSALSVDALAIRSKLSSSMKVFKEGKRTMVQFRTARLPDGTCPKFELKHVDDKLTPEEALDAFYEQWTKKKAMKFLGGLDVVVDQDTFEVKIVDPSENRKKQQYLSNMEDNMAEAEKQGIIFDPKAKEIDGLMKEKVQATNCAWDFDGTAVSGVLESVIFEYKVSGGMPFCVRTQDGNIEQFLCIRKAPEPKPEPYKLADAKVRDSLMMKIAKSKDPKAYKEFMIHTFSCDNGSWKVNGLSASVLLEKYVWLDGSPCGELPKEA